MAATPGIPGCPDLTNDQNDPTKKGMDVMDRAEVLERIDEVAGFGVWRGDANVHEEAIENLEYFVRPADGFRDGDAVRIAAALSRAMDEWVADARSDGSGRPGVVYAWFDGQAGQLRMSFVSGDRGDPVQDPSSVRLSDRGDRCGIRGRGGSGGRRRVEHLCPGGAGNGMTRDDERPCSGVTHPEQGRLPVPVAIGSSGGLGTRPPAGRTCQNSRDLRKPV
ncbi:hypothetical protein ACFQ0M_34880 [Kitasatospora aburaviensis]